MKAILTAFAAPPGAPAELPLVPWAVLGRQLARLVVQGLNAGEDRGVRFLPLIGPVAEGERGFLEPEELAQSEVVTEAVAARFEPGYVVIGELGEDSLLLRWCRHQGGAASESDVDSDGNVGGEDDNAEGRCHVAFDPIDPWRGVRAAVFELAGVLGLPDEPEPLPAFEDPAARTHHFLALDAQLALEARLIDHGDAERGVWHAMASVQLAPGVAASWELLVDVARHAVREGIAGDRTADSLGMLVGGLASSCGVVTPELQQRAARLLLAMQRPEQALPLFEAVCSNGAPDPEALLDLSHAATRGGSPERCREPLRRAVAEGCTDQRVRAQLAACEDLEGGDAARRDLLLGALADEMSPTKLTAADPPAVVRIVAAWLADVGDFEAGLARIDAALVHHPEHYGLWLERGRALLGRYRPDDAREALKRCLSLQPPVEARDEVRQLLALTRDDGLLTELGEVWQAIQAGRLRFAARLAGRLRRRRPDAAEVWLAVGIVAERRGRRRTARRAFGQAVELEPDWSDARIRLARLCAQGGELRQAYEHAREVTARTPQDADGWVLRGELAHRLGDLQDAQEALRRAAAAGAGANLDPLRAALQER